MTVFETIHKEFPSFDFKGVRDQFSCILFLLQKPQSLESITDMEFTFKDRKREIKELTKGVCLNYVAFWTKIDLKKRWNLFSITRGSRTGKTRLAISTLQLVRNEFERGKQRHLTLISKTEEVGAKIFDLLVGSMKTDYDLPSTLYIDLCNGDYIQDWTVANNMECKNLLPKGKKQ